MARVRWHEPEKKTLRVVRGLRLPQGLLSRFEALVLAERVGFEPTVPCGTPDFESDKIYIPLC